MNDKTMTTSTAEPAAEKQTKPTKPKRTDEEKLQECYKSVTGFVSRKPPTRIKVR